MMLDHVDLPCKSRRSIASIKVVELNTERSMPRFMEKCIPHRGVVASTKCMEPSFQEKPQRVQESTFTRGTRRISWRKEYNQNLE